MTTLTKDQAVIAGYQLVRGAAPSASTYLALSQSYAANGEAAVVAQIQGSISGLTNAQVGALVVSNAGFTNRPDLAQYVADLLGIFGTANRGQVVLNLAERLLSFTNDATYGTVATNFANVVASNTAYSQSGSATADRPTGSNTGTIGTNFTLTTGVDVINGSSGNDTIIADNTATAKQLTSADQINGGAGTDTLKIFLGATDTATGQPTLNSIETVWLNGGVITAYTAATGTTGLTIEAPAQALTVAANGSASASSTYTVAGQAVTLKDLKGTTTLSSGTATGAASTYTTSITSTADTALNLTVNNLANSTRVATNTTANTTATVVDTQTVDVGGSKVASLALTSTGAASTFTLTNSGGALTAITVAGDKNVTFTESLATVKSINAAAATGNVAVNVAGVASTALDAGFTFVGGSGADRLTIAAGVLGKITAGTQLDGGAGTDTLVLNDIAFVASDYAKLNAVKGFEVLGFGTTAAVIDASQLTSIKSFTTGVATTTINGLGTGNSVAITAGTTAVNLGAAVGNSTTDITLGTASTAGFTTTKLTTTGLTNITLTSNGTSAQTITTLANSDNTTLTIKGSADLTIANPLAGNTTGSKVDASALTGKLTVTGTGFNDVIIGGTAADTITGGAGADTITGGAGADRIIVGTVTAGGIDTITDFAAGTDKILVAGGNTTAAVAVIDKGAFAVGTFATLDAVLATFAAGAANATAVNTAYTFTYNNDTYVLIDAGGNAGFLAAEDAVVKITGVTGTITAADFLNA